MCDSFFESWQDPLIQKINLYKGFVSLAGSILLVSDRMQRTAEALSACFAQNTSCAVLGVAQDQYAATRLVQHTQLNFFIFVGYQLDNRNYQIHFPGAARVLWATSSPSVQTDCKQYSIPHQFEKFSNPGDFFHFLQTISR